MISTGLKNDIQKGIRDGIPIGLGYFAVAFSLGITAKAVGMTPVQGFISSFLNHASAGEFALISLIGAGATYLQIAITIFITNMRYLLMGAALSQKIHPDTPFIHRIVLGFGVTDEIFGLAMSKYGWVSPPYIYGAFFLADLMWSLGSAIGIVAGNILPAMLVSALSVAIYGMFLAVIIPPAKNDRVITVIVAVSFICSALFGRLPLLSSLSAGTKVIVLTLAIASLFAVIRPVKGPEEAAS